MVIFNSYVKYQRVDHLSLRHLGAISISTRATTGFTRATTTFWVVWAMFHGLCRFTQGKTTISIANFPINKSYVVTVIFDFSCHAWLAQGHFSLLHHACRALGMMPKVSKSSSWEKWGNKHCRNDARCLVAFHNPWDFWLGNHGEINGKSMQISMEHNKETHTQWRSMECCWLRNIMK